MFARIALGVVIGALTSLLLMPLFGVGPASGSSQGPVAVSDASGELEHIELHWVEAAAELLMPTYTALLEALHPEIAVSVVVESQAEFDALIRRLANAGVERDGIEAVVTGYAITPWSRDRYTLAQDGEGDWVLVVPEASDGAVSERWNDWMVPWALARSYEHTRVAQIPLRFDGGDLLVPDAPPRQASDPVLAMDGEFRQQKGVRR